jgi:NTP pyrophosphatase (non-canonical NTP hydrolase)
MQDDDILRDSDISKVLNLVRMERLRQFYKWGIQHHSWPEWITILTEEVGEAAQAAVECYWNDGDIGQLREELIQVAAVACQIIEVIGEEK